MRFELTVLGANSASPLPGRFPSSFVLNHSDSLFLIDCGEGAQIKMSEFGIKRSRIDHIFVSHLHGDHIFGLPGFINSLSLNDRTRSLTITGPEGIKSYIEHIIKITGAVLGFSLEIIEILNSGLKKIISLPMLDVFAFPMKHRIPTYGYKFVEKERTPNIDLKAIQNWSMSIEEIKAAKKGLPLIREDRTIPNKDLVLKPHKRRIFSYCSDTIYDPSLIPYLQGTNLLYHEATYLHEMAEKARQRMHSTSYEAGMLASNAEVQTLLIGHYSSRYKDLKLLLDEARAVFPNTYLAEEGKVFTVGSHHDKD